jgi:hypothetical protein
MPIFGGTKKCKSFLTVTSDMNRAAGIFELFRENLLLLIVRQDVWSRASKSERPTFTKLSSTMRTLATFEPAFNECLRFEIIPRRSFSSSELDNDNMRVPIKNANVEPTSGSE